MKATVIRAGKFLLMQYEDGQLWLQNERDEGMQVEPKTLERKLLSIWRAF